MSDAVETGFEVNAKAIYERASESLFQLLEMNCEGAIAVDTDARVIWINEKYRTLLGVPKDAPVIGRPIEEIIPHSLMRSIVETGNPILLDLMEFGENWFVVTRIPVKDENDRVTGGVGFVLFDRLEHLQPIVDKFQEMRAELEQARKRLATARQAKFSFSQFVGASPAVLKIKQQARRTARLDSTVLLTGETGTGKELLAHAIHNASSRRTSPLVSLNMAAIPESLVEAELFGVAPGAYTGADRNGRIGKFKLADGGTLFLDEIGELPLPLQSKLLRVLQEHEFEPLGSNNLERVNVRVIAATSCDLEQLVDQGRFRPDLYYRLNILPIRLPPLRERPDDIPSLCEALLESICVDMGVPPRELHPAVYDTLAAQDWPGNVRQLRNILERACALTDATFLVPGHFDEIVPNARSARHDSATRRGREWRSLDDSLDECEHQVIVNALQLTQGNKSQAARILGISRARLYDRIARHQIVWNTDTPSDLKTAPDKPA